jgi:hypothetical protein
MNLVDLSNFHFCAGDTHWYWWGARDQFLVPYQQDILWGILNGADVKLFLFKLCRRLKKK